MFVAGTATGYVRIPLSGNLFQAWGLMAISVFEN
jgi:hypothetical protein